MKNPAFALIVIIVLFSHHSSLSQWTQTNGPSGANIFSIESSGKDIFAGVGACGKMHSDNHGGDRRKIGYEGYEVKCLAPDGSALYTSPGDPDREYCKSWNQRGHLLRNFRSIMPGSP